MTMVRANKLPSNVLKIDHQEILPGERKRLQLEVASLFDYTQLTIPIEIIRGKHEGLTLFISAAIHGDELNGVEIIKRLLQKSLMSKIKGTLIAVSVVIHSKLRDGSLREAARNRKVNTLLFESGEALRFNEKTIEIRVRGCLSVMRYINMLPKTRAHKERNVFVAQQSYWDSGFSLWIFQCADKNR
jgi:predicted deacylase